jgi:hypothetical protein
MTATIATRTSWKNSPMSEQRAPLAYQARFSAEEIVELARGFIPREMEDKWFIFQEGEWLYFHRSWTGLGVYAVRLREENGGGVIAEAWVARDAQHSTPSADERDVGVLRFLVDRLLLGRRVPPPDVGPTASGVETMARLHGLVGSGRGRREE